MPIENGEDKYPGEIMLLFYINNNILIYHLSYSVVYQDEYENWELYQEMKYIFGVETNPQKLLNLRCI